MFRELAVLAVTNFVYLASALSSCGGEQAKGFAVQLLGLPQLSSGVPERLELAWHVAVPGRSKPAQPRWKQL